MYGNSLIVFTSDHGEEFWEHGGFEHGHTLYNEVLRVPLIIKPPTELGFSPSENRSQRITRSHPAHSVDPL